MAEIQFLFDKAEKDFNIPAAAVYPGNSLCCRFQKVGNE